MLSRFKKWEVYNDAAWTHRPSASIIDRVVSTHWTRFGATMHAADLRRVAGAMGFSAHHHDYKVRRRA